MAARVCPYCRELNGVSEPRCHRCGRRLPGPLTDGAFRLFRDLFGVEAPVTRVILFLELAVFALCVLVNRDGLPFWSDSFKRSTLLRFGALIGNFGEVEPWRLVSAVFVHANVLHLVMNLWVFTDLGRDLEREIKGARLALVFVLSGVFGFVASQLWYAPHPPLTMGASGAVFGLIGAVVGTLLGRRDPEWKRALVRNIVYALILSLLMPGVNNAAHLGGLAAGVGLGFLFQRERARFKLELPVRVLAGVTIVLTVASVVLATQSPIWQVMRARELMYE
jgi:membrane associated rhomboid family serine protease